MNKIIVFAGMLSLSTAALAQNVGVGTSSPSTKLDINGALRLEETALTISSNAATIPSNVGQVQLTTGATGIVTLSGPTSAYSGQQLVIYNNCGYAATFTGAGSSSIAAGTAAEFIYSNSAWVAVSTTPSGSGSYILNQTTQQASSNFNISGNGEIGTTAIIGTGEASSSPTGGTLRGPNAGGGTNTPGGALNINGGYAYGSGLGGTVTISGGTTSTGGTEGPVNIRGGYNSGIGEGNVNINDDHGGNTYINSSGGTTYVGGTLIVGTGDGTGSPIGTTLRAPNNGSGGNGGTLNIAGGYAYGNNNSGGDVIVTGGGFGSSGYNGNVRLRGGYNGAAAGGVYLNDYASSGVYGSTYISPYGGAIQIGNQTGIPYLTGGVLSIAAAGTNYQAPIANGAGLYYSPANTLNSYWTYNSTGGTLTNNNTGLVNINTTAVVGTGEASSAPGAGYLRGANAGAGSNTAGGALNINGGYAYGSGLGGTVTITGGTTSTGGTEGPIYIRGGWNTGITEGTVYVNDDHGGPLNVGGTETVTGLVTQNGGLTETGTAAINTSGTATTTIGNSSSATSIGGTETVTGLVTQNGGLTETGTAAINNSGTATTTIGVSGTGAVNIGNATGKVYLPAFTTAGIVHNAATGQLSSSAISLTTDISGTLPVANGGTGATTLTGYISGNGTSAMTASSTIPGSAISGNISGSAANVTGTVAAGNGGTGATTLTGYVIGNGTSAMTASSTIPGSAISGNIAGSAANVTGTVAIANGGTALTSLGSANQVLGVNAGATGLEYKTITAGTGISIGNSAGVLTITNTGGSGGGGGTVTSVGLVMPSFITVTNSPVTSTGTLTGTLASQSANTVFAGPTSGSAAPGFRSLVAADIPTLNQSTTGTAANVTGTVAIANGGTGATSAAAALSNLGGLSTSALSGTSGQIAYFNGSNSVTSSASHTWNSTNGTVNITSAATTAYPALTLTQQTTNTNYGAWEGIQIQNTGYYNTAGCGIGFYNLSTSFESAKIIANEPSGLTTSGRLNFFTGSSGTMYNRASIDQNGNLTTTGLTVGIPTPSSDNAIPPTSSGTTFNNIQAGTTSITAPNVSGQCNCNHQTVTINYNFPSGVTPNIICTVQNQSGTTYGDTYATQIQSKNNGSAIVNVYRVDGTGSWGQSAILAWFAWY